MISIGKPEIGAKLCDHLGIKGGEELIFVDPENQLYDDLDLNRGVVRTLFNPATPESILERMKNNDAALLGEVLGKWSKAFFIPPKMDQGYIQGGSFVFDCDQTLLAHYDVSTGAHADINTVIDTARKAAEARNLCEASPA